MIINILSLNHFFHLFVISKKSPEMLNFNFGRKYHFVKLGNDMLGCNNKLPRHSDFQENLHPQVLTVLHS